MNVSVLECLDIPISVHRCIIFTCEMQSATYSPPHAMCTHALNEQSASNFCAVFLATTQRKFWKLPTSVTQLTALIAYALQPYIELLPSKIELKQIVNCNHA